MKQAINTRTQEEYDALMRYLDSKKYKWESGHPPMKRNYWWKVGEYTCVHLDEENELVGYGSVDYFETEGYEIIPYTEFAKANIEPDYKALYLEGRELLEKLSRINKDTGVAGSTWGDTDYDSLSAVFGYNLCLENIQWEIKAFLTKHNDLTTPQGSNP